VILPKYNKVRIKAQAHRPSGDLPIMTTLKVSLWDKNIHEIIKVMENYDIGYEIHKNHITISLTNPDFQDIYHRIKMLAEEYL